MLGRRPGGEQGKGRVAQGAQGREIAGRVAGAVVQEKGRAGALGFGGEGGIC